MRRVACVLYTILVCCHAIHVLNSYRIPVSGQRTQGSFQVVLSSPTAVSPDLTEMIQMGERGGTEAVQNLDAYSGVDVQVSNASINCAAVNVLTYLLSDLNPFFTRINEAKQALRENGFDISFDIKNKSVSISTSPLQSATSSVHSKFKRTEALYSWSSVVQETIAEQLLSYVLECPENAASASPQLAEDLGELLKHTLAEDLGEAAPMSANSSVLSGLTVEQALFYNNSATVHMDWCGEPKCKCDAEALNLLRNSSKTIQPPDPACTCYVTTQYESIDFEGFRSKAEIHESSNKDTTEVPEYACGEAARVQCLRRATQSAIALQGQFTSWRTGKCLYVDN